MSRTNSKSAKGSKSNKRRTLTLESMEPRQMMAAHLMASLSNGVLYIEGTNNADNITVRQVNNNISVSGINIQSGGRNVSSVSANSVSQINIYALGGDDKINLASEAVAGQQGINKNTSIHCGSGNDTVWGDIARDWIYGEDGNDQLMGRNGDDVIYGGLGNDKIWCDAGNDWASGDDGDDQIQGGTGNDILDGKNGNDTLYGEAGNDQLFGGNGNDWLIGGAGRDRFVGGAGSDNYSDDFNMSAPFVNGQSYLDVTQGEAGTCTFHSTLTEAIQAGVNFVSRIRYVGNNQYDVLMYRNGKAYNERVNFNGVWTDTDSRPGTDANGYQTGEFWTMLTQRAYLQSFGVNWSKAESSWAATTTQWRNPAQAIAHLTGRASTFTSIASANIYTLANAIANHHLVVAGTKDSRSQLPSGSKLVENHAYAVLGVNTSAKTVTVRNPWGTDDYAQGANDGVFTISWNEFVRSYTGYTVS